MDASGPTDDKLQTSNRDRAEMRLRLEAWLAERPDVGPHARVDDCVRPEANGMSSDTLLFDASWDPSRGRGRVHHRYVARIRPAADACPIFPAYDLERQVRVMRLVGERSSAPVPTVHWYEPDERPLGAAFFVMDRVDGQVPPDVMPYPFDGTWVSQAAPEQRAHMQARTLDVLAAIHDVPVEPEEVEFLTSRAAEPMTHEAPRDEDTAPKAPRYDVTAPDPTALRGHFQQEWDYYGWAREGTRFPVLERAFEWLEQRWPSEAEAAPPVVSWGDARIGNILYRDFEPQAVLDWEMATLAPRELDLGWFIFLHRFFQDIATSFEMAGLPDFLQRDQVVEQYTDRTGHAPRDLDWFIVYAALRHGTIMTRAMRRRVLFGEVEMPDEPEDLIMHRHTLEQLIS